MKAVLVYQCGIANVFKVDHFFFGPEGRNAVRLYQGGYLTAVAFVRGLVAAGTVVHTAHCDAAGDVAVLAWRKGKGDLWADYRVSIRSEVA